MIAKGQRYCHQHATFDFVRAFKMGATSLIGHGLAPGVGGVLAGAVAGWAGDAVSLHRSSKKRVFLSFDYEHDKRLKDFMVGQARLPKSPFTIVDTSLQEAAPEPDWERHAALAIGQSDLVMIMLGRYTHVARGVQREVKMAKRAGKPCIQVRPQGSNARAVAGGGRVVTWSWDRLAEILG